jgi:hypothetical protein
MINDLDNTLRKLLLKGLPRSISGQVKISFATPDDQFPPQSVSLPAIDLFLYDIRENVELRSNETFVDFHSDGSVTKTQAPLRVDFSYLITAWPSESLQNPSEDEHHLLGEVMRVLVRHKQIPSDFLEGELVSQSLPLPVISLQPGRLQSLGEFWQALGGKPKVALNLMVTLSIIASEPEVTNIVTDKIIKLRLEEGLTS